MFLRLWLSPSPFSETYIASVSSNSVPPIPFEVRLSWPTR